MLSKKGKAIVITIAVIVGIIGVLLFSAWAYGYANNMEFKDVMTKLFDSEKYDLNVEVKELTKVKLGYESSIAEYTDSIETQRSTIELLQETLEANREEIQKLKEDEVANKNQILALENENASLQRVINSLNDTNTITSTAITMMTKQLGEINELLNYYIDLNTKNLAEIKALREKNANLEKQLTLYKRMVSSLVEEDTSIVTFMYGDTVYDIQLVKNGNTASVTAPLDNAYYYFRGWTLNDTLVDLSQTVITEDTVFEALLDPFINMSVTVVNNTTTQRVQIGYFDEMYGYLPDWRYDSSKLTVVNGVCTYANESSADFVSVSEGCKYLGERGYLYLINTWADETLPSTKVKTANLFRYGYLFVDVNSSRNCDVKVVVNGVTYDMAWFNENTAETAGYVCDCVFDISSIMQDGVSDYEITFIVSD